MLAASIVSDPPTESGVPGEALVRPIVTVPSSSESAIV